MIEQILILFILAILILVIIQHLELKKANKKLSVLDKKMTKRKKRMGKSYLTKEDIDKQREEIINYDFSRERK